MGTSRFGAALDGLHDETYQVSFVMQLMIL